MKTRTKFIVAGLIAVLLPALPAPAVDLLEKYPTTLTAGDSSPDHAKPWKFSQEDIFQVSQFELKVGDGFKVATGPADVGIGHGDDGAVWAVLLPRTTGTLTSPVAKQDEAVAHIWLRFHPGEIDRLLPADTVTGAGDPALLGRMQDIARAKFGSSWHTDLKALIPDPKDVTVYADTKSGTHRFFVVDTKAQTAEYIAAFDTTASSGPTSWETAPPVVVKTVPEAGTTNVPPGETEIQVTFSKEMQDGSWSWCDVWDNSSPAGVEKPRYDAGHKTCVLKVKLEPGKTYACWLNTKTFRNFKDRQGHPAVPYLLVFQTKDN